MWGFPSEDNATEDPSVVMRIVGIRASTRKRAWLVDATPLWQGPARVGTAVVTVR